MRWRNVEIRPFGGGRGLALMVLISVVGSILLTVIFNLLAR